MVRGDKRKNRIRYYPPPKGSKPARVALVVQDTTRGWKQVTVQKARLPRVQIETGWNGTPVPDDQRTGPSRQAIFDALPGPRGLDDEVIYDEVDEHGGIREPLADTQRKGQHDYLREWLPKRSEYLDTMLEGEAPPQDMLCHTCHGATGSWRCNDCFGCPLECTECFANRHGNLPFHRIERWNSDFFAPSWLRLAGVKIYLGHGGMRCPLSQTSEGRSNDDPDVDPRDGSEDEVDPTLPSPLDEDDTLHFQTDTLPRKARDAEGNPILCIVDSSGIHRLPVVWCRCANAGSLGIQLFKLGLFPASFHTPETAFTFRVLDDFRLDNLECKTTAYHFFHKLRRLTSSAFPTSVPDRYRELLRVERQWRDLKMRKWFGMGHGEPDDVPGCLGIFCPTCAQPDFNLPQDWKTSDPRRWIFQRTFVMDGNFESTGAKMRRPANDVKLSDGAGFMVREKEYKDHLKDAQDHRERSTCNEHRAVNRANSDRHHVEHTGIGTTACCHGCFYPHATVDFQKGERQMNMDYSFCQAVNYNSKGIEIVSNYYDVECQWHKGFPRRVKESQYLTMPDSVVEWKKAIGLFHVHGHKDECVPSFSPNYIVGARQFDGEVVETLWAPLNEISRSTGGMSTSHRREVLDDHMNDSNWKKLVGMVRYLCRKYREGTVGVEKAQDAFNSIDESVGRRDRDKWARAERKAQKKRAEDPQVMVPIYNTTVKTGPSRADILVRLNEREMEQGEGQGSAAWITLGLRIQETQLSILGHVRKLGRNLTAAQRNDLSDRRRRLQARVTTFERAAMQYLPSNVDPTSHGVPLSPRDGERFDYVGDDDGETEVQDDEDQQSSRTAGGGGYIPIERVAISLPSRLDDAIRGMPTMAKLIRTERRLREGQANDTLQSLRLALGHKAFVFRQDVRHANSQRTKTRAWDNVISIESTVQQQARIYSKCREAMVLLGASQAKLTRFQPLLADQLKVHTVVLDTSVRGLRNATLPWFWTMDVPGDSAEGEWLQDFHRVQWLRARARLHRWEEEMVVLPFEMEWTVRGFDTRAGQWASRCDDSRAGGKWGAAAYAARQRAMWVEFGTIAQTAFTSTTGDDPRSEYGL